MNATDHLLTHPVHCTSDNVEQWIRFCYALWVRQIHLMHCFKWATMEPEPSVYPGGVDEVTEVVGKLHAAGIGCSLHCYSMAIMPTSLLSDVYGPVAVRTKPEDATVHALLPNTEAGVFAIADATVEVVQRVGANGLHLDALDWSRRIDIDGTPAPVVFVNRVYERLTAAIGPPAMFTMSMQCEGSKEKLSHYPTLDNPEGFTKESVDKQIAMFDPAIPPGLGWRHIKLATDLNELQYLLNKSVEHNARIGWQDLDPTVSLDDPRVRAIATANLRKLKTEN